MRSTRTPTGGASPAPRSPVTLLVGPQGRAFDESRSTHGVAEVERSAFRTVVERSGFGEPLVAASRLSATVVLHRRRVHRFLVSPIASSGGHRKHERSRHRQRASFVALLWVSVEAQPVGQPDRVRRASFGARRHGRLPCTLRL